MLNSILFYLLSPFSCLYEIHVYMCIFCIYVSISVQSVHACLCTDMCRPKVYVKKKITLPLFHYSLAHSLSISPKLPNMVSLSSQLALGITVSTFQGRNYRQPSPYCTLTWVLNCGPHACIARALTTKSFPQPQVMYFLEKCT